MQYIKVLFALMFTLVTVGAYALTDSIGLKIFSNNKVFIVHKVEKGQGLYGISKRYNVTIPEIESYNPEVKTNGGVKIDQYVFIPTKLTVDEANKLIAAADKARTDKDNGTAQPINREDNVVRYTVKAGETLYSISKLPQCKFSVDDLKKWNNLKTNSVSEGQRLIIAFRDNVQSTPDPVSKTEVRDIVEGGGNTTSKEKVDAKQDTTKMVWSDVKEEGIATWIEDGDNADGRSYALYNGAKVGTIVRVENLANGKVTYVRVIGPLAGNESKNVIMVLTETAAKKLAVTDATFRIELAYSNDQL